MRAAGFMACHRIKSLLWRCALAVMLLVSSLLGRAATCTTETGESCPFGTCSITGAECTWGDCKCRDGDCFVNNECSTPTKAPTTKAPTHVGYTYAPTGTPTPPTVAPTSCVSDTGESCIFSCSDENAECTSLSCNCRSGYCFIDGKCIDVPTAAPSTAPTDTPSTAPTSSPTIAADFGCNVFVDASVLGRELPCDGSYENPCRTIQQGVEKAKDGDVVCVREGTAALG